MMQREPRGWRIALAFVLAAISCAPLGAATLSLEVVTSSQNLEPGDPVQIVVHMTDLGSSEAAGFQAFLQYDQAELAFQNASYTFVPFGLWVITPITASGGQIDLASGINVLVGQQPTSADSTLATLNFTSVAGGCGVRSVHFRAHNPPTRLTTLQGQPIRPLTLADVPGYSCPGDVVPNDQVDVNDLLLVVGHWGVCPSTPTCCPGDIDNDEEVDVNDLLTVVGTWGPCP